MFSDAGGAFPLAECEHFLSLSSVCLGMLDVEASGYLFHRIRFPDPETGEMPFCLNIHMYIDESEINSCKQVFSLFQICRLLVIK